MAAGAKVSYRILRTLPLPVNRVLLRLLVFVPAWLLLHRSADRNLQSAFGATMPRRRRRQVVRKMIGHMLDTGAEVLEFRRLGPRFLHQKVDDQQAKVVFADFEAQANGWIGVTGHIGNWELLGQWLHLHSKSGLGGVVARRVPNPSLQALVEDVRGAHGLNTLYRDDSPTALLRALRNGKGLGMVPDQDVATIGGVFVEFMGRPAYTPVGPARLAYSAGAPIIVGVFLRSGRRYQVQALKVIRPDLSKPRDQELLRMTKEWSEALEEVVRIHPEQWPWFHDRFKTTPEHLAARGRSTL